MVSTHDFDHHYYLIFNSDNLQMGHYMIQLIFFTWLGKKKYNEMELAVSFIMIQFKFKVNLCWSLVYLTENYIELSYLEVQISCWESYIH